VNEQLVAGREDVYFGWQFASKAAKELPGYAVRYYVDTLAADPEALHGSFAIYRALDITITQNQQRKDRRLRMPVLAIGGAESLGDQVAATMKLAAADVQALAIRGCGHHPAEETPEATLTALSAFLAPYRDGLAGQGGLIIAHELCRVGQAMQRPGLEARPAKIETRLAVAVDEAMNETRELQTRSHVFSSPAPIRAPSVAVIMTILPSLAISIRAILTPALVVPLMAFVTSCCLKIDGARVIVRPPLGAGMSVFKMIAGCGAEI